MEDQTNERETGSSEPNVPKTEGALLLELLKSPVGKTGIAYALAFGGGASLVSEVPGVRIFGALCVVATAALTTAAYRQIRRGG